MVCSKEHWLLSPRSFSHLLCEFCCCFKFRDSIIHGKLFNIYHSVHFSRSVVSDSLQPHGLQHTRPPCPSPIPRVYPNSCPFSQWCHPTISSCVVPFSSCLQSFPASGSFQMSQFFASGGQSIGASASVLSMNIQDWFPLGCTGSISLKFKGLSSIFSNTTVQKHLESKAYCNPWTVTYQEFFRPEYWSG